MSGDILTNYHVVDGATAISVRVWNGQAYKAHLVGSDASYALAIVDVAAPKSILLPPHLGGASAGQGGGGLDENGVPFLQPVTQAEISDALNAAAAVGDDRIQQSTQGQVAPESFTHGPSAPRAQWFTAGPNGRPQSVDPFRARAVPPPARPPPLPAPRHHHPHAPKHNASSVQLFFVLHFQNNESQRT